MQRAPGMHAASPRDACSEPQGCMQPVLNAPPSAGTTWACVYASTDLLLYVEWHGMACVQAWTGEETLGAALLAMAVRLPRARFIIVTLGADGCAMLDRRVAAASEAPSEDVDKALQWVIRAAQEKGSKQGNPVVFSSRPLRLKSMAQGTEVAAQLVAATAVPLEAGQVVDTTGAGDAFIGAVLYAPAAWGASRMQLVTVPSARAVCLDGSPAGYYFRKGTGTGTNKWLIYFHGGGWCTTAADCQQRAKTFRGSSRFWPKPTDGNFTRLMNDYHTQFTGILSADTITNPVFGNWNLAVLMYCDGGAYMGYKGRVAVGSSRVFYSGRRVVMLLLEDMLKIRGLSTASAVLITGCSAGGQGVAVSCDWMASRLPSTTTVKCAIDAGYFLDEPDLVGHFSFRGMMQRMMVSQWSDASFDPQCVKAYPRTEKWRCIFPANALQHTQTPFLVLNSAFDLAALAIGLTRGNVEAMTGSYESVVPCYHSERFLSCPRRIRKYVGHHAIVLRNSLQALVQNRQAAGVQSTAVVPNKTSHCTMAYDNWSVPDASGVRLRDVVAAWFFGKQL
ncbi:unnamed protein product [Closterium sp. NIES-64]|nr:unnamed protein product [Closterium sp. NIES-64]